MLPFSMDVASGDDTALFLQTYFRFPFDNYCDYCVRVVLFRLWLLASD